MKSLLNDSNARYFNREMSWLAFNHRVLEEASDTSNPILERLKYLTIVSTNLEEFFMVRVASLLRMRTKKTLLKDGYSVEKLLFALRNWVYEQKHRQAQILDQLSHELSLEGIFLEDGPSELAETIFREQVLPNIYPIKIAEGASLPPIPGSKLLFLASHLKSYSLIELPTNLPRLIITKGKRIFLIDRLISTYRHLIFKNIEVSEIFAFKVSRDAQIEIDEEADDPILEIEQGILGRKSGPIVRIEVDSISHSESVQWLQNQLKAAPDTLYQLSLPLDLRALYGIYQMKGNSKLKFKFPPPKRPLAIKKPLSANAYFKTLKEQDVFLHHPFDSFDPVVELIQVAATDNKVTRICQTLYRTTSDSPIIKPLMLAAQKGKKVTALIEIKARFDEANNIRLARQLEKSGVKVIYGTSELKVHAKLSYVERKSNSGTPDSFVHISTGNYHPNTAKIYTDIGFLTSDPLYGADARFLFDSLEKMDDQEDYSGVFDSEKFQKGFKCWKVSPQNMHQEIIRWIQLEAKNAKLGKASGIRGKMNGLVEPHVIDALYKASQAGVPIDLFVRGMCCLRPGVPGLSETIRVRSLVDKYLEHSRFFIFENGGEPAVWISSADWMPRNFFRRIELAVPILNSKIRKYVCEHIWKIYDEDNIRTRECTPDGSYKRILPLGSREKRAQWRLQKIQTPRFMRSSKS